MHAQVTTVEVSPAKLDEATHHLRQHVLPELQQMEGFEGFIVLGDQRSGKLLSISLWESEEVMQPTAEVISGTRGGISHPRGGAVVGEEDYEVPVFEVSS
jgi:heme-degrading monooxygenase HmoA